jgi:Mg2+ and Co2+ transporter CorA
MRNRSWKVALAAVALIATAMALYVQLFERRARQEEDRLAAARLKEMLEESRSRVEALEQRRAELTKETGEAADQPLPGAVLRRGESGSALQQVRNSQDEQAAALDRLQESVDTLALQMEQSDQALRRDLELIRMEARREQEASNKTLTLLLAALVPLVLHLLLSLRSPGGGEG